MFLSVKPSPVKICPRCPPQFAQVISVRMPSLSELLCIAPGISSSKLGQPQVDSNLLFESYSGASHCRQTYTPVSLLFTYSPINGISVPFSIITLFSSDVSSLSFILFCYVIYYVIDYVLFYSHSIVPGGLEVMSYTTRLIPLTSLVIRLEILAKSL